MNVWWLLAAHLLWCNWAAALQEEKCLHIEEVNPKKYFHLNSQSLTINLETSTRATHELATYIFYYFIKEVLGYAKINVNVREDNFIVNSTIQRLTDYFSSQREPPATINLEVWLPADYLPEDDTRVVEDFGTVGPPGRFGWFIPSILKKPVTDYYNLHRYNSYFQEVHWSLLTDPLRAHIFDIPEDLMSSLIYRYNYVKLDNETTNNNNLEYFCNDPSICSKGVFIPSYCNATNCGMLLAPHYNESSFLVDQILEMKLLMKVVWLGNNLRKVVTDLTGVFELESHLSEKDYSVIFFYWSPSEIIIDQSQYISVFFTNNELMGFTKNKSIGYKYEMHRLVKMGWNKIEKNAPPLYEGLREIHLTHKDYVEMLTMYNEFSGNTTKHIACKWMQNNRRTWIKWKKDSVTEIFIGGIFPVQATTYNGLGIVSGAIMAADAVNKNKTILPNYRLKLLVQDGKCKADSVMKHFIEFIVQGYYPRLVGVLGPACSETVEPLAGVCRHYHIMVISYSAEGASFSDREKYPYFFRTIGENKHYKHVYLNLFELFGWKRVAALTEDGQKYTEYISLMQDDLEKNNIKFIANKKFPREREDEAMTRYLEDLKNKRARIIIADVVDNIARAVMCDAYKLEMTAYQGYVWFLPTWLNATWYNTDYFNKYKGEGVNCTTAQMIQAITGYFSMTHAYFAPDDTIMQENITVGEWRKKYAKFRNTTSNYGGFAYDAVWTYALALDKLAKTDGEALSDLHSENTTNKLVRLVEETDFIGVSGRIKFRGGPSRFSVINILQWYDDSVHKIGHFNPNLTEDRPEILGGELTINLTLVKWFTPDKKTPKDGTLPPPKCDYPYEYIARLFSSSCFIAEIIFYMTILTFVLICSGVTIFMLKKNYDKKVEKTKDYIKALGFPFDMKLTSDLDKWEINRESVVINRKLGQGAFGTVYGGEANLQDTGWCAVAVKTLKLGSTTEEKLDFLSEAEVMKRFEHPNIVKLLGVCTKDEPIYTIMEFMLYGDLKTYLLSRRNLVNKNYEESEEVSSKRLTAMAMDVARGLSYLASKKYIHRDIASRNCLVNAQRSVKIGDFGMTRAMFENDYYKFTRRGMLPVRWMSPESLELGMFSTASDVWSYGVLLYEIITFGSFPFQGKSNSQVLEMVKNGQTLNIPKAVKPQLEALIKSCWMQDSKKRPHASQIVDYIANNPRIITPCLDAPLASVQQEDSDQAELGIPSEFRKYSTSSKSSPQKTCSIPVDPLALAQPIPDVRCDVEGIPMEEMCAKEPLLGKSKSSSSLLNIGHLMQRARKKDEDDDFDTSNLEPSEDPHPEEV